MNTTIYMTIKTGRKYVKYYMSFIIHKHFPSQRLFMAFRKARMLRYTLQIYTPLSLLLNIYGNDG